MRALSRLLALAAKSDHDKYQHAALVYKGGSLISQGNNRQYSQYSARGSVGLHAEVAALARVQDKRKLKNSSVTVIRVNKAGLLVMSRPCPSCIRYMRQVGVSKMIYSDDNGDFVEEKLWRNYD